MNSIEEKAIENCKAGQLDDFEILYDKYFQKIYAFIYYRVGHRETAEDLTGLAFMKAIENINKFKVGTFSSWLYKIARNNVIDHYRTDKSKLHVDINDAFGLGCLDQGLSTLDNTVVVAQIKEFLESLPTLQRDIILMRVWDELSYKEIAEIVGKSEDSCKMAFSRAIGKVRAEFAVVLLIALVNLIKY
jgi:RNA polymerase sigma-70 factor (ECF subfamily)